MQGRVDQQDLDPSYGEAVDGVVIPDEWERLPFEQWRGPIIVIGGVDSGKTTFARYCYHRYLRMASVCGLIDLDVGQNSFGLPTTIGLEVRGFRVQGSTPPRRALRRWRWFVGQISPVRAEARILAGLQRFRQVARRAHVGTLIVDTSGFIDAVRGAAALKWAEIEMLRPCTVVGLQRGHELTSILAPLRRLDGVEVVSLPVSEYVRARSREARRAYRAACYRTYFASARQVPLWFGNVAAFAYGAWRQGQVAALEDRAGFLLRLAIVEKVSESVLWIRSPRLVSRRRVAAFRLGQMCLHPQTYQEGVCGI